MHSLTVIGMAVTGETDKTNPDGNLEFCYKMVLEGIFLVKGLAFRLRPMVD